METKLKQRVTLNLDPTTVSMIKSLAKQRKSRMAAIVDEAMDGYHRQSFCDSADPNVAVK